MLRNFRAEVCEIHSFRAIAIVEDHGKRGGEPLCDS
jgi:hypothetical protein